MIHQYIVGNKLNADLNKVAAWIKSNGLKINVAKPKLWHSAGNMDAPKWTKSKSASTVRLSTLRIQ